MLRTLAGSLIQKFGFFVDCLRSVQTFGTVIKFLTAEKVPPIEFHRRMQAVFGDHCVDVSTVRRWVRRFKFGEFGQADLSNKTRSGRPVTASDQLHEDPVEQLIGGNRCIKKKIAVAFGVSKERMGHVIGVLGFRKVCVSRGTAHFLNTATPGLTQLQQQEMQFNAWTFQCCLIHCIAQIWLQVISTCSQN